MVEAWLAGRWAATHFVRVSLSFGTGSLGNESWNLYVGMMLSWINVLSRRRDAGNEERAYRGVFTSQLVI